MGISALLGYVGYPVSTSYTNIKVYGQNIVQYVHVKNVESTTDDIQNMQLYVTPSWGVNTLLLAKFENNLDGGNISGLTSPLLNWNIFRRKTNETSFTFLKSLPATATSYIDATAEPNVGYVYQAIASNDTELSTPIQNGLLSSFYNCVIASLDGSKAYIFDYNLEFDGYENETAYQRYDGYDKYSSYSFGKRDFKTGNVTAILADIYSNGVYTGGFNYDSGFLYNNGLDYADEFIANLQSYQISQFPDYIKEFNDFINNGEYKIFKDRKGNVLKVVTTQGVKQSPLNIAIGQQPYMISFHFEESGEVNG